MINKIHESFKKDIQRHHGDYDEKLLNMLSSMTHKKHGKQVMIDFNRNDEHNIQYIHFFINANIDLIQ